MNEKALELRVGLVVLATIAVLVIFVLLIGDFHFAKTYTLEVDFKFSGALAAGAPVKISGMHIGRVDNVSFIGDQPQSGERLQTAVILHIDRSAQNALPEGTEFFVSTQGILGEPYIEAVPGDHFGSPLQPGTVVRGVDPPRTDLMLARMAVVLDAFSGVLSQNRGALGDLVKAMTGLTHNLDDTLSKKKMTIEGAVDNLSEIAKNGREISQKLDVAMGEATELRQLVKDVTTSAHALPGTVQNAQQALGEGRRVLQAVDAEQLKKTMANAQAISDDAKAITKKMRRGEGTVGALLADEDIYDDLKELVHDLKAHPWKIIWRN